MERIKKILRKDFDFLFEEYQFEFKNLIDEENSEFVAVLGNDQALLRFIIDRADFFLDIRKENNQDSWEEFLVILDRLYTKSIIKESIKPINKKSRIKSLLKKYLPVVLENLNEVD